MKFTVYVLYSLNYGKIYVGYTSNLQERLKSHNELAKKGWTIRFRPWTVIYTDEFPTKSEARKRENELKSARGRAFIWDLIKYLNIS